MIVVFAGNRPDESGIEERLIRFPASAETAVATTIHRVLRKIRPAEVVGGASSGADTLFLEAATRLGIPRRVVLPFAADEYLKAAVKPSGALWVERAMRMLASRDTTVTVHDDGTRDRSAFLKGNLALISKAVERAESQSVEPIAVVVRHLNGAKRSVSDEFVDEAVARGLRVICVDPMVCLHTG